MRDFKLETHFTKWEFTAKYHLTASDCESLPMNELLALASQEDRAKFETQWLGYTETKGNLELRELIGKTYDHLSAEDVLCFAGAEEGLYVAMKTLLTPDDHAIVFTPNYQAAETIPLSICAVSGLMLRPENDWEPDLDELKTLLRPNTKLISINFPHNPTGKIISESNLRALVTLCRERGIWLFSDEVYRGIESDPTKRVPQAADLYERGLSLNVMSKAYGLPGLRIGWIACQNRTVLQQMNRYKNYLSICNSAPSEQLSIIALKARNAILARNITLIQENLSLLRNFFADFTGMFEWYEPDGGCVAYPRYKGDDGVDAWTEQLVEKHGALLLPANIYQSELTPTPTDRFRIGFGRANLAAGLNVLRDAITNSR